MAAHILTVVRSASNPEKTYEIREGADGNIYCTCPSWRFQRVAPAHRSCKHLRSFFASQTATKCHEDDREMNRSQAASLLAQSKKKVADSKEMAKAAKEIKQWNEEAAKALLASPLAQKNKTLVEEAKTVVKQAERKAADQEDAFNCQAFGD